MPTPINSCQDILEALERDPALGEALRRHILTSELLQVPVRLDRVEGDVVTIKDDVSLLKEGPGPAGGEVGPPRAHRRG